MNKKEITIIGGSFDQENGKSSSIVDTIKKEFELISFKVILINGGNLDIIKNIKITTPTLLWMPNIDNSEEKILPSIKENHPHLLLISSKRVVEKDYKESDIIGRLLKSRSNLGIMITKPNERYQFQLLDPLGNQYCNTTELSLLIKSLGDRINFIQSLTRIKSVQVGPKTEHAINNEFISMVQELGAQFSKHVNAVNPNRFLGNASTRCSFGFPAIRETDAYYVSERNINKESITSENFIKVLKNENLVEYFGDKKPSVDTPIQIKLFNHFKNVNYIIHGHVYAKNAIFTQEKLPCGSVEEFNQIKELFKEDNSNFVINLLGHGCIICANDLNFFKTIEFDSRNCPEENPLFELAKKAGAIALKEQLNLTKSIKKDKSIVTNGDLAVSQFLESELHRYYPKWNILSEENATKHITSSNVIIIDPIDGTESFARKQDSWSVLIGFISNDEIVQGLVYQPTLNKLFYAEKHNGALFIHNGLASKMEPINLNSQLKGVMSHKDYGEEAFFKDNNITNIEKSYSAALKIMQVASSDADIYANFRQKCSIWDLIAPLAILNEVGGSFITKNQFKLNINNHHIDVPFICIKNNLNIKF